MIYANLPVTCRFIPIDVDDEVFQIIFMLYFRSYLKNAAQIFLDVVDAENTKLNEGDIVNGARWAKDIYENYENIKEDMDEFKKNCLACKRTAYIANNVYPYQLGFNFYEVNCRNVTKGIELYNLIYKKI